MSGTVKEASLSTLPRPPLIEFDIQQLKIRNGQSELNDDLTTIGHVTLVVNKMFILLPGMTFFDFAVCASPAKWRC